MVWFVIIVDPTNPSGCRLCATLVDKFWDNGRDRKSFEVKYRFDYQRGFLYEGDDIIFRTSLSDYTFRVTLQEAEAEATSKCFPGGI